MALIQRVTLVIQVRESRFFVLGLLDVVAFFAGLRQFDVAVKACLLELDDLVLGLAHDVSQAVASI